MIKVEGKKIAQEILNKLSLFSPPSKFLAAFLVGENLALKKFVEEKKKVAQKLGLDFRLYQYSEEITNDEFRKRIRKVAEAKNCGGVLIQLPLPNHLNPFYLVNVIPPSKDIEVMSERMIGAFYHNRCPILPPAVAVVLEIFRSLSLEINSFKRVAILGQGFLVGRPLSCWFSGKVAEVFSLDKGFSPSLLKEVDLVILGTGQGNLVKAKMLKKGAGVIDFGYSFNEETGKIEGDFDLASLKEVGDDYLSFYTPTPGGTGPILIASLLKNFYLLNEIKID
ncbi:MAG: bifunctional protein FolD [Candidatus Parcubacteria bacterium]|nr:MAG: bifunctional protein FolD [Candidatus Parcubacteria bacterium]